jgi:hypothetical protein
MSAEDRIHNLEAALRAAQDLRIATGSSDRAMIEALETALEAARNPPFVPVFGAPAAPVALPPPPPPAPPPPVQITVKGTWGVYTGPKPEKIFRERD